MNENVSGYIRIADAIRLLNVSRWTLHRMVKSGELKKFKVGKTALLDRAQVIGSIKEVKT